MNFIAQHWLPLFALYIAYSTAVNAMPVPAPGNSPFYVWLYRFAHGFAANLVTAFGKIGRTPWAGETPVPQSALPQPPNPWPPPEKPDPPKSQ